MAVHQAGSNMASTMIFFTVGTKENTHKHINKPTHLFGYSQWDPVLLNTKERHNFVM